MNFLPFREEGGFTPWYLLHVPTAANNAFPHFPAEKKQQLRTRSIASVSSMRRDPKRTSLCAYFTRREKKEENLGKNKRAKAFLRVLQPVIKSLYVELLRHKHDGAAEKGWIWS